MLLHPGPEGVGTCSSFAPWRASLFAFAFAFASQPFSDAALSLSVVAAMSRHFSCSQTGHIQASSLVSNVAGGAGDKQLMWNPIESPFESTQQSQSSNSCSRPYPRQIRQHMSSRTRSPCRVCFVLYVWPSHHSNKVIFFDVRYETKGQEYLQVL